MAATVFNIAKGKVAYYAGLPSFSDGIVVIPLETAGIESDAILQDYDTVAALLAGPTNEANIGAGGSTGRKVATGVTVTVDDTNNRVDVDCADMTWVGATGVPCSRILFAYDPDTTGGTDADLIPLVLDDFIVTPSGGDITYQVAAGGFYRAS